jgi:hypothetical protein
MCITRIPLLKFYTFDAAKRTTGYATLHQDTHPTKITTQPLPVKTQTMLMRQRTPMHRYIQSVHRPNRICLLVYCKPFDAYAMGLMSGWGTASNFVYLSLYSGPILMKAPLLLVLSQ